MCRLSDFDFWRIDTTHKYTICGRTEYHPTALCHPLWNSIQFIVMWIMTLCEIGLSIVRVSWKVGWSILQPNYNRHWFLMKFSYINVTQSAYRNIVCVKARNNFSLPHLQQQLNVKMNARNKLVQQKKKRKIIKINGEWYLYGLAFCVFAPILSIDFSTVRFVNVQWKEKLLWLSNYWISLSNRLGNVFFYLLPIGQLLRADFEFQLKFNFSAAARASISFDAGKNGSRWQNGDRTTSFTFIYFSSNICSVQQIMRKFRGFPSNCYLNELILRFSNRNACQKKSNLLCAMSPS